MEMQGKCEKSAQSGKMGEKTGFLMHKNA